LLRRFAGEIPRLGGSVDFIDGIPESIEGVVRRGLAQRLTDDRATPRFEADH
jgi:hypothetical protein